MPTIEEIKQKTDAAMLLSMQGDICRAIHHLDNIIREQPLAFYAKLQRGLLYWKLGLFSQGSIDIKDIYGDSIPSTYDLFNSKKILNTRLDDQTVIITNDSGLGDIIQFVRYGLILKSIGAKIIVECQPILFDLFNEIEWIDGCTPSGKINFEYKYRIPLHYLPGTFSTNLDNIPHFDAYLKPRKDLKSRHALFRTEKIKVGICWRSENEGGSVWTTGRKISLEYLFNNIYDRDIEFISLQKSISADEKKFLKDHNIIDPSDTMKSMLDTASLILQCNAVVSTCTMIPHLSAALGKTTYTLLSTNSCWRWLTGINYSPWYPKMKLLRQQQANDWTHPISQLKQELRILKINS